MAKPGSETAILWGAMSIPISDISIQHSGKSYQRSEKPIPGAPKAFLNSEFSIRDCRLSIRETELPIPMQTAASLACIVMRQQKRFVDQDGTVSETAQTGQCPCPARCR